MGNLMMRRSRVVVCCWLLSVPLCLAQAPTAVPNARSSVVIVQIKPELLDEWIELQKNEVIPALKKGGVVTRTVWRTVWGNSYEFAIATPFEKFAQRDSETPTVIALGQEAAARLGAKIRRCLVNSQSYVSYRIDDLSYIPPGESPPIAIAARVRIAPDKIPEWEGFIKSNVLPVYKKANARYVVSRRNFGANVNDRTLTTYAATFAELEAGSLLTHLLSPDALAKLTSKGASLSSPIETIVRQRQADLSF